jgi:HK97 family phage major capsid protein
MGRVQYQAPAGAKYSLANLITGEADSYEASIAELIEQRSDPSQRLPGAQYLPSGRFARALGINTGNSGADLVSNGLEAVAAAARPPLLLERLGAQRLEVNATGPVSLPSWVAGAGGWIAEGSTAPQLNTTVRSVEASGRMAAARIAVSRRMLLNAAELESALLAEVSAAVADVVEGGFIAGNGSLNAPLGLLYTTGAGSQAFAGATPTYSELMSMVERAGDADAALERCVYLLHPSTLSNLLKAQIDADGGEVVVSYAEGVHRIGGFPVYATRHLPEGKALFLDPSVVRTVYWSAPQVIADRTSGGKSLSGAMELVIFNLCDLAVLHPGSVVVGGVS